MECASAAALRGRIAVVAGATRGAGRGIAAALGEAGGHYRISVFYDAVKSAVNRLAFALGHELAPVGATAVAVTPGWLRSEIMLDSYGVTEQDWRLALQDDRAGGAPTAPAGFAESESPRYVGRAVAALAADERRSRWNRHSVTAAELAREYGFTDVDGRQPDAWSHGQ